MIARLLNLFQHMAVVIVKQPNMSEKFDGPPGPLIYFTGPGLKGDVHYGKNTNLSMTNS